MTLRDRRPTRTCTRCGLPVHETGSRCTDCRYPYAKETAMPAQRSRTLPRPGSTDEHEKGADWREDAACKDTDGALFFQPDGRESVSDQANRIADAKSYCDRCPVRNLCLQIALDTGEQEGIWGGLDPDERRRLKRRATRKPQSRGGDNRPAQTKAQTDAARERVHDLLAQGCTRAYITRITGLHKTTVGRIARAYEATLPATTTPKDAA